MKTTGSSYTEKGIEFYKNNQDKCDQYLFKYNARWKNKERNFNIFKDWSLTKMSLKEVGLKYHIAPERVRQIHARYLSYAYHIRLWINK